MRQHGAARRARKRGCARFRAAGRRRCPRIGQEGVRIGAAMGLIQINA
jgi:hypothetical protein